MIMKIQQFNPRMISISQLRRQTKDLEKILAFGEEALIMRNQSVLFVAISPEKYREIQENNKDKTKIAKAISVINKIRQENKKRTRKISVGEYVSKMREQRTRKWKR